MTETPVSPRPTGPETPDGLSAHVRAGEGEDEEELSPRVSTILGPLPAGASVKQTRDLNDAVHRILIYGLAISTVLLIIGLGLELLGGRTLPTVVLPIDEAVRRALALRASGFLSLGLLVLLATPIVRVIGSVIVFAWERDRRYTLITLTVLIVMAISVYVGHG